MAGSEVVGGEPMIGPPGAGAAPDIVQPIRPHPLERYHRVIEYDEPTDELSIGVVVPFDFGLDWEYWKYLPEGVSLYFTRTPQLRKTVGVGLAKDVGRPSTVARATRALLSVNPKVVLYACSSGSFVRGVDGERELRQAMLDGGAPQAVTSAGAMVDALRAVGARRIAVATPYTAKLTERIVSFLEELEFEVLSTHYLGISRSIAAVNRATIRELVRETYAPGAEAVFVSCTALRTYGIVAELEAEIGCPVFTSNQVSLWGALRAGGTMWLDPDHPGWVIGGGRPMARSTELLIRATQTGTTEGAA